MSQERRAGIFRGVTATSLGTLASRALGMLRDVATASLLGLSDGVLDALVIAFRIPNLFRGLFGEGALAASYLPVLAGKLQQNRREAWQLVSATLGWLSVFLAGTTVVGEAFCGALAFVWRQEPSLSLTAKLSAILLPYLLFICLAAQVSATLQALGRFAWPAVSPALLNVIWLAAAWWWAPAWSGDPAEQATLLAWAILLSGALQLAVQWPPLLAAGYRPTIDWSASQDALRDVMRAMLPTVLGLAVTRISTLLSSLIAWGLASDAKDRGIPWLGGALDYPMRQGAVSAIYCAERLYQFPVGLLGVAVATVIFPLLSRHAARGDHHQVAADLMLGLRLVTLLAMPAGAGLMLLAVPITQLLFEHGEFTAEDTARTARLIVAYGAGVWAFCALPVLLRGFYAIGDRGAPLRVGTAIVLLNLLLNVLLVWPLAETGMAAATSACAVLQTIVLCGSFSSRLCPLDWRALRGTALRTAAATALMCAAGSAALAALPPGDRPLLQFARVAAPLAASVVAFAGASWMLGDREVYAEAGLGRQKPPRRDA